MQMFNQASDFVPIVRNLATLRTFMYSNDFFTGIMESANY